MGKKGLTKREKLLLFICSSHLQSRFTKCTGRVAPQGIHNHPLTQHKSFIPLSPLTGCVIKPVCFTETPPSSLFSHSPPTSCSLPNHLTNTESGLRRFTNLHKAYSGQEKGDSDLLAKFVF